MTLSSNRTRGAGFTLIEVVCVMVILAIAAAIVFAGLGDLTAQNSFQAQAAARQVMADLLYAQNRAIATQQNVYVTFNTSSNTQNGIAGNTYALCSALPSTYLTNPISQANYTNGWGSANWTVSSVAFGSRTAMYFDPLGSPWSCTATGASPAAFTAGGTVQITSGGYTCTITIENGTGDMTVQ